MCGVIGMLSKTPSKIAVQRFAWLMAESRVRGMHAFGFAWGSLLGGQARLEGSEVWWKLGDALNAINALVANPPHWMMGLARYSTSGDWRVPENNQPVLVGEHALVFNGVISQASKPEMEREFGVSLLADNDGEILLRKLEQGFEPVKLIDQPSVSFAGIYLWQHRLEVLRNARRPLYVFSCGEAKFAASTRDIIKRALGAETAAGALELPVLKRLEFGGSYA